MSDQQTPPSGPAFYAQPKYLSRPRLREWWTLLHPPYTMFLLSLVVIGASLVGPIHTFRLWMTVLAFFLAVGIGAHAMDELQGRPLRTTIPTWQLVAASILSLGGAVVLGIVGAVEVDEFLWIFIAVGVVAAVGYNLELFGGRLHTDLVFFLSWGCFPVLTAYFTQHENLSAAALLAALYAAFIAATQRQLSTPARRLRRHVNYIQGDEVLLDGSKVALSVESQLGPIEGALRSLCWTSVAIAGALMSARYHFF
jgi:hypothetical protein